MKIASQNIKGLFKPAVLLVREKIRNTRRSIAERLLPNDCFVQQNPNFNYVLNYFPDFFQDAKIFNDDFTNYHEKLLRDGNRWLSINLLLNLANACETGDFAELGTYRGATARLIWNRLPKDNAHLYCFDTFEGFTQRDVFTEREKSGVKAVEKSFGDTSEHLVRNHVVRSSEAPAPGKLVLRKGQFPETFEGLQDHPWRFVHLDCDLYAPMKSGLECFWPGLVPGGVLLIHDYNAGYLGVKKAVDEYFEPLGIVPVPLCDKVGSVVVIKQRIPDAARSKACRS